MKKNFSDPYFAQHYRKKHARMLKKFGNEYAGKLLGRNVSKGRILDAGCGSGDMLIALAGHLPEFELFGVDTSDPLLKIASRLKNAHLSGDRVKFLKADVLKLPFDNDSFEVVLNVSMVHFVDDPVLMLNELDRVIRPGGHLYIKDLRYSWLKIFEHEIRNAYTLKQAFGVIQKSNIKSGNLSRNLLWWNFESYNY
jgi:ubiquinone/menaquinone biosynthesis C-methylase UbiE